MRRMRYTDFADEFIRYLYRDSISGDDFINFEDLASKNEIPYETGFLVRLHRELKEKGFLFGPNPIDGDATAIGSLTGAGLRYVESIYKDDMPEGPSAWRELGITLSDNVSAVVVPASDRLVTLDHNRPEYVRVKEGLEELREAVRSVNDLPDRDRLLNSLIAAQSLWAALELKAIQIKVGVIMAIEDAGRKLATTVKAVATGIIIDAIKSLVKAKTNIDLDHL